jgi:hypothetical protein
LVPGGPPLPAAVGADDDLFVAKGVPAFILELWKEAVFYVILSFVVGVVLGKLGF